MVTGKLAPRLPSKNKMYSDQGRHVTFRSGLPNTHTHMHTVHIHAPTHICTHMHTIFLSMWMGALPAFMSMYLYLPGGQKWVLDPLAPEL